MMIKSEIFNLIFDEVENAELKQQIIEEWKGIDIIVANVGSGESVAETIPDSKHWDYVFSLNFDSALNTAREFYPLLLSSKGNLIFISSIVGMLTHTA